jgi:hypothetical protein
MTTTDHIEGLRTALATSPEDWDARRILADALDEAGRHDEAAGQRWQAEHQRRPREIIQGNCTRKEYLWYEPPPADTERPKDPESDLPMEIFDWLEGFCECGGAGSTRSQAFKIYTTAEQAEQALSRALMARVTPC